MEVAVLGADGKVVRHLAAGVLGGKLPPPEPLKAGLAQTVEWDLRDDFGKPPAGGPFKVRVRAGTGVKFGRTISDSPYVISDVLDLATDQDGNLYVLNQNFGYGTVYLQVFDAGGRYLRTIMPFPANLPRESVAAFARWDDQQNRPLPQNWMDCYGSFLPIKDLTKVARLKMIPSVTAERGVLLCNTTDLWRLDADGGTGGRPLVMARTFGAERTWPGKKHLGSGKAQPGAGFSVAASPDGRLLYAAGPCAKGRDADWPAGGIYRMELKPGAELAPFSTLNLPDDWEKKAKGSPVAGLAVDSEGRVYAADRVGNQVVVLDTDGKKLGVIPVKAPEHVAVHPRTGEVYMLTVERQAYRRNHLGLVKFSGWKEPRQVAAVDFGIKPAAGAVMALSAAANHTVVWVAGLENSGFRVGRADVTCYEDKGAEFVPVVRLHEKDPEAIGNHDCIAVDPATEDVYINDDYNLFYRYNGLTGEGGALDKVAKGFKATDLAVGPDGCLYVRTDRGLGYSGPFERLDRDLKPVPFPSGTHLLSKYIYSRFGAGYGEKGIGVGRDGKSYVSFMYGWTLYCTAGFGPDGKPLKGRQLEGKVGHANAGKDANAKDYPDGLTSAVIGPIPKTNGGVRVDSRGNVYIGVALFPGNYVRPELYAKDKAWDAVVGSVVRFGPEGGRWICTNAKASGGNPDTIGAVEPGTQGIAMESGHFLAGATAVYPEVAPFSGTYGTGRPAIGKAWCDCRSARFDLDRYDRLYLPNAIANSVRICDNAGNEVLRFGAYGNYDSAGPKSAVPRPGIPLGWPIGVGVSEEHIYVCDQLNRRVTRLDKTCSAEEACDVK